MKENSRQRIVRLLILVLSNPYKFKRKDLSKEFGVSKNTIDDDIKAIKNAGVNWNQNNDKYCAILPHRELKELFHLLPFSTEEQVKINNVIGTAFTSHEARRLKKKFRSLFDLQQLGLRALRRPELEKIDSLLEAEKNELQVKLIDYRSNSNEIKDRIVEPFFVDTENNMLQAFDLEVRQSRHFKINRIARIEKLKEEWKYKEKHKRKDTDVFRIADNKKIVIQLQLNIYAYNYLIERFPYAQRDIDPGGKENTYHFQSSVNSKFLGLTNFILANPGHIKIYGPEALKAHIKNHAQLIIDQLDEDE